ncbi:TIM barrel protein, partial [Pseudomonas aeruginosa]
AECFARHDKRILIEALNPQTKPGYLYHSQYQTLAMVKRVDRPNLAVQLDLFHAQKVDGNLSHLITEYAGQYRHIQIASLPDRHEPDEGERHCCKVSDEAAFCLIQRPYISKTLLTRRISPRGSP